MNQRQKEILQLQLDNEAAVLKKLQGIYKKALEDINTNIAALMGRTDIENLQSIVYQLNYQKALKTQINAILDNLATKQYKTIADYLGDSYEGGFLGTMYDLHGQGIPLIFPIDQDSVVRAVQNDAPLSKAFYDYLGEDIDLLKKRVTNNISRGMAQGSSYADIARNIASGMIGDYSKVRGGALYDAYRIARTEGHRIQETGKFDAQRTAKSKGADVVKQWDATLDGKTRQHHAQLDGQIREVDEPYEIDGRKAMYPGGFGIAAEDIHCRCVSNQRAKWNLDESELETLKQRAEYFGLDKTKDFEDFKKKYLKAAESPQTIDLANVLAGCQTTQEVSAASQLYFRNKPDCKISKVDFGKCNVDAAKDMAKTLDDLDNRFKSNLTSIRSGYMSSGIGGECAPTQESFIRCLRNDGKSSLECEIRLNDQYLSSKKAIVNDFFNVHRSNYSACAHSAWIKEENMNVATLVHEYGHSILPGKASELLLNEGIVPEGFMSMRRLYNTYMRDLKGIEKQIMTVRDFYTGQPNGLQLGIEAAKELQAQYDAMCISTYSKSSLGEFIAEAFCDAELSENPKPTSLKVYDALMKVFGKEN